MTVGIVDDLMVVPCTITPRTQTGAADRGNTKAWEDGAAFESGCFIEQIEAEEITDGRETQIATAKVYLPASVDLAGAYRIEAAGVTYEVLGPPDREIDPFAGGVIDHTEAKVRVITG